MEDDIIKGFYSMAGPIVKSLGNIPDWHYCKIEKEAMERMERISSYGKFVPPIFPNFLKPKEIKYLDENLRTIFGTFRPRKVLEFSLYPHRAIVKHRLKCYLLRGENEIPSVHTKHFTSKLCDYENGGEEWGEEVEMMSHQAPVKEGTLEEVENIFIKPKYVGLVMTHICSLVAEDGSSIVNEYIKAAFDE